MNVSGAKRPISVFLSLLCIFSVASYALVIHSHHETAALSRFAMWCPSFAALCTCLLVGIPIKTLGWRWSSFGFLRLAYLLPLAYATPVYLPIWFFVRGSFTSKSFEAAMASSYGLDRWPMFGTFCVALPLLFTITVIGTAVWALGEEIGWRGFLFPRLQERFGFHGACLISGAIWAVWHYPMLLWADYNAGTNAIFAIVCFSAMVVAMGYIMGYLRVRSESIWPCVLLHAAHNSFVQGLFDPLTAQVGWAKYITTEFGVGLVVTQIIAAVLVTRGAALKANVLAR